MLAERAHQIHRSVRKAVLIQARRRRSIQPRPEEIQASLEGLFEAVLIAEKDAFRRGQGGRVRIERAGLRLSGPPLKEKEAGARM